MATGQIQLGANLKLSRNSLSSGLLGSFFYWRRRVVLLGQLSPPQSPKTERIQILKSGVGDNLSRDDQRKIGHSRRQHLILQTICAGKWGRWSSLVAHQFGRLEVAAGKPRSGTDRQAGFKSRPFPLKAGNIERCPAPAHLFYDNPSSKRVARCTNILHTGATLSGVGEGQRLRKGFQNGGIVVTETLCYEVRGFPIRVNKLAFSGSKCLLVGSIPAQSESLSSAAEIRHSARNTRLWDTDLCLCLNL